ncbi:MAG: DNA polymerase III subunit gamma/tau, partial [Lachnospiraceae bacterium]|nr:DNA polymerase III subunit gamma/tau [Lachnospiraceae bacterium]
MSYTALYRKFRPDCFEDVKGQEHIVTTLKNQIKAERIGHAYLFCGTRGTGKTTIAKIFAKAVNCEHPVEGSPCGECQACKTIASGASMNVIEIDAASNNGVDNIREIVEEVSYSPAEGKYKVYIIDEVHMLSIGAFNALLKTLEEPPSYVIFILATTEVHKIPITILSRCQRYDFRRITIDTITGRLRELMDTEQIQVEEKALRYVAKTADGSMRDALSLLDQCIAFHFGQELTYDKVLDVLGAVDTEVFGRLLRHVLERNVTGCIELLEEIVMQGRELTQFVTDFTWYLRNLLLVKSSDDIEDVIDVSTDNLARLREEADMTEADAIMRYIRIFSELSGQIKYAAQKRILIEIALIKLCRPDMEKDYESIVERVRAVEEKIENGIAVVPAGGGYPADGGTYGSGTQMAVGTPVERPPLPKAIPEDVQAVVDKWATIVGQTSMPMKQYLKDAGLSLGGDNKLMIVVEDGLASDYFLKQEGHKEQLVPTLS